MLLLIQKLPATTAILITIDQEKRLLGKRKEGAERLIVVGWFGFEILVVRWQFQAAERPAILLIAVRKTKLAE